MAWAQYPRDLFVYTLPRNAGQFGLRLLRGSFCDSPLTVYSKSFFLWSCDGPFKGLKTGSCWTSWFHWPRRSSLPLTRPQLPLQVSSRGSTLELLHELLSSLRVLYVLYSWTSYLSGQCGQPCLKTSLLPLALLGGRGCLFWLSCNLCCNVVLLS
jgi:hypothetical protein